MLTFHLKKLLGADAYILTASAASTWNDESKNDRSPRSVLAHQFVAERQREYQTKPRPRNSHFAADRMEDSRKESNGHDNLAMSMDDDRSSTPRSNNNRKIGLSSDEKTHAELQQDQQRHPAAVVFEDLPHEPNFVMDKIENFWRSVGYFAAKYQKVFKIFGLVLIVVLYNCYFFGAVSYYVQYKVRTIVWIFLNLDTRAGFFVLLTRLNF